MGLLHLLATEDFFVPHKLILITSFLRSTLNYLVKKDVRY